VRPVQQAFYQGSVSWPDCPAHASSTSRLIVHEESTLKRHGYYCRSNRKSSVPRRRSCAACAQAKMGCDNLVPACSRCTKKGLTCRYPFKLAKQRRETVHHATSNKLYGSYDDDSARIVPLVAEPAYTLQAITPASDDPVSFGDIQWSPDEVTAFDHFMSPTLQSTFHSVASSSSGSTNPTTVSPSSLLRERAFPIFQEQNQVTPQQERQHQIHRQQCLSFSISPAPSSNVRSMIQRPKLHPGADRTASLIFYTLKSYPLMLRQNILPPFIHPSYVSFTDEGTTTEPLENCIALMHMMTNGAKGSRKLFWRNVKIECERICAQNQTLNKWEILGAMQALSIYILIRLDEGETEHNNLDHLLERAVIVSLLHPR
jgi:hypothetical protein